ncbi:MAG: hypothetical protein AAFV53_29130 [Myxococcota bacterium]
MLVNHDDPTEREWFEDLLSTTRLLPPSRYRRSISQLYADYYDEDAQSSLVDEVLIGVIDERIFRRESLRNTRRCIALHTQTPHRPCDPVAVFAALRALGYGEIDPPEYLRRVGTPMPAWLEIIRDGRRIL